MIKKYLNGILCGITVLVLSIAYGASETPGGKKSSWPNRVLLTNDDGINEDRIWHLAKAFSKDTDTWVIASQEDRSGTSNRTFLGKYQRALTVERLVKRERLTAYAVSGYPADCIAFGLLGPMSDALPDLIISGINGGPNLGVDWFGSGTIGAARTAAYAGLPAIAISGLDDKDTVMVQQLTQWIKQLAQSSVVRQLKPGQYLTVAVPRVPADQIKGIRIAHRMPAVQKLGMRRVLNEEDEDGEEAQQVWVIEPKGQYPQVPEDSDGPLYYQNYIVITPMSVGEVDTFALEKLAQNIEALPKWQTAPKDEAE